MIGGDWKLLLLVPLMNPSQTQLRTLAYCAKHGLSVEVIATQELFSPERPQTPGMGTISIFEQQPRSIARRRVTESASLS
jgi:hypothetical protein